MICDYENFKDLNINKNIKINVSHFVDKIELVLTFDKYKIIFNGGFDCCNWPGACVKKKKINHLFDVKKIDMGFVKKIKLNYGKEIVTRKIIKDDEKIKITDNKNNSIEDDKEKTTNVFSLDFGKNKKLVFFNGNNNGYYNYDFIIYKEKEIIFKSSL